MKIKEIKNPASLGLGFLAVLLVAGIMLVFVYAGREKERDLQNWQVHLGLVADHRVEGVNAWVKNRFSVLHELAKNSSLQLYMTELAMAGAGNAGGGEPAPHSYLRNLLLATAEREGFLDKSRPDAVKANIATRAGSGLALFDAAGAVMVSTPGMASPDAETQQKIRDVLATGSDTIRDLYLRDAEHPAMGFLVPVFPLQSVERKPKPIGVLLGLKNAGDELYPLLARKEMYQTEEAILVRRDGDSALYLAPLADGTKPFGLKLRLDTPELAAAFALSNAGTFAQKRDYKGMQVLVTSRAVPATSWVLVEKIAADEALKESNAHQRFLLTSFLLATFFIAATLVAAWRHGSSVRERKIAEQLRIQSRQLAAQSDLLHSVTDNITDFIYIVDQNQRFVFANKGLAAACILSPQDFPGKTTSSVFGPETAKKIEQLATPALSGDTPHTMTQTLEIKPGERLVYYSTAVPLASEPAAARTALIVSHDITALQEAQHKRELLMQQVLRTLMRAVDMHDPFCANHSSRTAQVALAIGKEMTLNDDDLEALEMATNLANVGKLMIPKELLTKIEPLSQDEQDVLRRHAQYSVDILSGLEFTGPVLKTIAQKNEHIDGSGYPQGLRGEQILPTAKILAVANAFVAMVNSRAYRAGMTVDEALDQLLAETKSKYDRQVVAALFHVAENRSDWITWRDPDPSFPSGKK